MTPANREEPARALDCIDPDLPRDGWVCVLMALHSQGEQELAREWSAQGSKWDERAFDSAWRSFHAAGNGRAPVTLASVFHLARDYGYVPSASATVRVKRVRTQDAPLRAGVTATATTVNTTTVNTTTTTTNETVPAAVQAAPSVDGSQAATPVARFMRGTDARQHPYVLKKRMSAERLRVVQTWDDRLELGALFVSVSTGAPATIQVVGAGGRKRNWPRYLLGDAAWRVLGEGALTGDETVFVAEGVATAWACVEAMGAQADAGNYEAFACAGKGNLRAVAEALRARYPALDIVIVSDRDAVAAATKAAHACAGRVAVIPADLVPGDPKADAWDVWDAHGPAALAAMLDAASEPEPLPAAVRYAPEVGIAAMLDAMRADDALAGLLGFDQMRWRACWASTRCAAAWCC